MIAVPKGVYDHDQLGRRRRERDLAWRQAQQAEAPAVRDMSSIHERVAKLRELLYESEKVCQWLSQAINTPDLPAGSWIYVDALRMAVMASMRNAQIFELKVAELVVPPPAAERG